MRKTLSPDSAISIMMEAITSPYPFPTYRAKKPTHAEHENRVIEVFRMLLAGHRRGDIVEYCRNKWGLKRAAADNLIRKAKEDIIKESERDKKYTYALAINRLELLFKNSYQINDYKTCLSIIQIEGKLQGLTTPPQVNVSIDDAAAIRKKIDDAIKTDPENRARITAALQDDDE